MRHTKAASCRSTKGQCPQAARDKCSSQAIVWTDVPWTQSEPVLSELAATDTGSHHRCHPHGMLNVPDPCCNKGRSCSIIKSSVSVQAEVCVLAWLQPASLISVDRQGHVLQWDPAPGVPAPAWQLPSTRFVLPTHLSLLCPRSSPGHHSLAHGSHQCSLTTFRVNQIGNSCGLSAVCSCVKDFIKAWCRLLYSLCSSHTAMLSAVAHLTSDFSAEMCYFLVAAMSGRGMHNRSMAG